MIKKKEEVNQRFFQGQKNAYKLNEKLEVAELIAEKKEKYDEYMKNPTMIFNSRKRKMQIKMPKQGFISEALREYYYNLKDLPSSAKLFKNARDMGHRAFTGGLILEDFFNLVPY